MLFRIVAVIFLILFNLSIQAKEVDKNFPGQLTIDILQKPTPVIALNKYYLVYELHLTNYHASPITLTSLKIIGDDHQEILLSSTELTKIIHAIGENNPTLDPLILQPGTAKIIFMWLPFSTLSEIPDFITHEIAFTIQTPKPNTTPIATTLPLFIEKTLPIVIDAPLRGDNWVAGNALSNTSVHRQANMVFDAHDYFAQRYAIDFVKVDKSGITSHGDKSKNTSYFCYGLPVYAVAPGRVVAVKNDIPENTPGAPLAEPISRDTITGNYILLDIGQGKYAFYAHLIPGSLKVKVGDKVHQKQILAKIGNSGNSTEPHLHFHVIDAPSPLAANGIPYLFNKFYVIPVKTSSDQQEEIRVEFLNKKTDQYIDQLVLENTVMGF